MAPPVDQILRVIETCPGLTWRQVADKLDLPLRHVEDIVWNLWSSGKVQMENDSTLRLTRPGERVFRYDA